MASHAASLISSSAFFYKSYLQVWPEFRFSHKGNAGADKDHVGGIICSYHISAVNNDIDRGIKRMTRTQSKPWRLLVTTFCALL